MRSLEKTLYAGRLPLAYALTHVIVGVKENGEKTPVGIKVIDSSPVEGEVETQMAQALAPEDIGELEYGDLINPQQMAVRNGQTYLYEVREDITTDNGQLYVGTKWSHVAPSKFFGFRRPLNNNEQDILLKWKETAGARVQYVEMSSS